MGNGERAREGNDDYTAASRNIRGWAVSVAPAGSVRRACQISPSRAARPLQTVANARLELAFEWACRRLETVAGRTNWRSSYRFSIPVPKTAGIDWRYPRRELCIPAGKEGDVCTAATALRFWPVPAWLSLVAAAEAESITFQFAGRVDATAGTVPPTIGDSLFGSVSFEIPGTDAPPGSPFGIFQTRQDVFHLSFAHEPEGPLFGERTLRRELFTAEVFNNFFGDLGGPFDEFELTVSTFTLPHFNLNIDLTDPTGSVFTNGNLPTALTLGAFPLRRFVASIEVPRGGSQEVVGTFGGTITSLVEGPGPSRARTLHAAARGPGTARPCRSRPDEAELEAPVSHSSGSSGRV